MTTEKINSDGLGDKQIVISIPSAQDNSKAIVAKPGDIICGRGFHIANHRGNLDLHLVINKYRDYYLKARRTEKTKTIHHVLREVKRTGARFIRRVPHGDSVDTWEDVDHETTYKKVSHALRLRITNESNNFKKSQAGASALNRRGESNGELDQRIPIRLPALPRVQNDPSSGRVPFPSAIASHAAAGALPLNQFYRPIGEPNAMHHQDESNTASATPLPQINRPIAEPSALHRRDKSNSDLDQRIPIMRPALLDVQNDPSSDQVHVPSAISSHATAGLHPFHLRHMPLHQIYRPIGEPNAIHRREESYSELDQPIPRRPELPDVQNDPPCDQVPVPSAIASSSAPGLHPFHLSTSPLHQIYSQVYLDTLNSLRQRDQQSEKPDAR